MYKFVVMSLNDRVKILWLLKGSKIIRKSDTRRNEAFEKSGGATLSIAPSHSSGGKYVLGPCKDLFAVQRFQKNVMLLLYTRKNTFLSYIAE